MKASSNGEPLSDEIERRANWLIMSRDRSIVEQGEALKLLVPVIRRLEAGALRSRNALRQKVNGFRLKEGSMAARNFEIGYNKAIDDVLGLFSDIS
jgi:hypothetical protein